MSRDEINATLGIDTETATKEYLAKRSIEFAQEMADCYEPGSLEADAFLALRASISKLTGVVVQDDA